MAVREINVDQALAKTKGDWIPVNPVKDVKLPKNTAKRGDGATIELPYGDKFVVVPVEVAGRKMPNVTLQVRHPFAFRVEEGKVVQERILGRPGHLFVTFVNNPEYHSTSYEEWRGFAEQAIYRYSAQEGLTIEGTIKPESTNRFSFVAEFSQ